MRVWNKIGIAGLLAIICIHSCSMFLSIKDVNAAAAMPVAPVPEAASAILMEASTGQVLYNLNGDEARAPASMSKMMLEYIVLDKIHKDELKWDNPLTISPQAASIGGSGQLLAAGETYTLADLFKAVSIYSSNDAAFAIAEYVSGSAEKFSNLMNDEAKTMGLSDKAYFIDPTGLDRSDLQKFGYDPPSLPGETQMTAMDAAIIARNIVTKYPEILEYTKQTDAYLKPGIENYHMINWNHMLEGWTQYKDGKNNYASLAYPGLDGLKTGTTDRAGACFTGTAERDGLRFITVVMGVDHANRDKRFAETTKLMDYGFNNFEIRTVLPAKSVVEALPEVSIKKGVKKEIGIVTKDGVSLVVPKNSTAEDFPITVTEVPEEDRIAPIQGGETVLGTATVTWEGPETITRTVDLVAAEDVDKAGWFKLFFRSIGEFFGNIFSKLKNIF